MILEDMRNILKYCYRFLIDIISIISPLLITTNYVYSLVVLVCLNNSIYLKER